jgi:heterodisulfide reductase subunit B
MVIDILESIQAKGADCMGLICPTCFDQFDVKQIVLNRKYKKNFEMPVIYYFQLLGLAQGLEPREIGFHLHKIRVDRLLDNVAVAS